jgi:hypothetical protein
MNGRHSAATTALVVGAAVLGAMLGGSMLAWANDDVAVISACYSNHTGALRLVAAGEDCGHSESPIQWNQVGQAGPVGPQGPPGPGLTGIERVSAQSPFDSEASKTIEADCPAGKVVLTGGARIASDLAFPQTAAAYLNWSAPLATIDEVESTSWVARGGEPTPTERDWSVVAWVWCVDDPTP